MDTFPDLNLLATQSRRRNSDVDFDQNFTQPMSSYIQSLYQDTDFSPSQNDMQGSHGSTPSTCYVEPESRDNGSYEDAGFNRDFPSDYSSPSNGSMSLNGSYPHMPMDTSCSPANSHWSESMPVIERFPSVCSDTSSYSPTAIPRQDFGNPYPPAMPVAHGSRTDILPDGSPYGNHSLSNVAQPLNQCSSISISMITHHLLHGKRKPGHLDTAADRIDQSLAVTSPSNSVMNNESLISKISSQSSRSKYCDQCERSFSSHSNLWRHNKWVHRVPKKRRSSHKIPVLECEPCKKNFSRPDGLKAHRKRQHQD